MLVYISVRGIDCASVSVILGLGFGTVLTCGTCHFITAFDHWNLTITFNKTVPHVELNPLTLPENCLLFVTSLCWLTFVCCVGSRWILFVFPSIFVQNRVTVFLY